MSLNLPWDDLIWLLLICFGAGLIRGFAGFALSAVAMALSVLILSPIALIPILWCQEIAASILMLRGGWADADRRTTYALVVGNTAGWPFGLVLTKALPVETSKLAVLALIISLAVLQLARVRLPFLATRRGTYGSGFIAGIAAGIAHVGGMVIALYVLARDAPARQMRGTLVLYLALSSAIALVFLLGFGVMNTEAALRGIALAPASMLGVYLGQVLFRPQWEHLYKPFCLMLLIALAILSLLRTVMT